MLSKAGAIAEDLEGGELLIDSWRTTQTSDLYLYTLIFILNKPGLSVCWITLNKYGITVNCSTFIFHMDIYQLFVIPPLFYNINYCGMPLRPFLLEHVDDCLFKQEGCDTPPLEQPSPSSLHWFLGPRGSHWTPSFVLSSARPRKNYRITPDPSNDISSKRGRCLPPYGDDKEDTRSSMKNMLMYTEYKIAIHVYVLYLCYPLKPFHCWTSGLNYPFQT